MKAIIPAAGKGKRMYSVIGNTPKELAEFNRHTLIYHAVKECCRAGVKEIIIIVSQRKSIIIDYFYNIIKKEYQIKYLTSTIIQTSSIKIEFVIQQQGNGSGGAILEASEIIGKEDFIVLFPDIYIEERTSNLLSMINLYQNQRCPIIMVDSIEEKECSKYGITISYNACEDHYLVEEMIEKPNSLPSGVTCHGIIGRYIFPNDFIKSLNMIGCNNKGEIDLSDAISYQEKKIALILSGHHYECGSADSYLRNRSLEREI